MADYDVFNGDADGLCALVQLRNAEPRQGQLITGVKRDIDLLKQVSAQPGDRVTVLDVSMEKNKTALQTVLEQGAEVFYVDHHVPGDIPKHPALTAIIDESPELCTSLLVNQHLKNAFSLWAITGAFGDNLKSSAQQLGEKLGIPQQTLDQLENLGICINYNGYGPDLEDLHFPPAQLFEHLRPYASPLDFMSDSREIFQQLDAGYKEDMSRAESLKPERVTEKTAVFLMPNEAWSRRASGVFGNALSNDHPGRAHAVITERADGGFVVSVRAPQINRQGAAELCKQFPTGGGRAGAAGINNLPEEQLGEFIDTFTRFYS